MRRASRRQGAPRRAEGAAERSELSASEALRRPDLGGRAGMTALQRAAGNRAVAARVVESEASDPPVAQRFLGSITSKITELFSGSDWDSKTPLSKANVQKALALSEKKRAGALKGMAEKATAEQREAVWKDAALLTQVDSKVARKDYLDFITKLQMFHGGTPAEGGGKHTSATEADELIATKLKEQVKSAAKRGGRIQGKVAVVAGDDWDRAGEYHYGREVWHDQDKKNKINGFVDKDGRVWIERNSGNIGTMVHEGLHKWSDGSVLTSLGFNVNEGFTEYFTRKICATFTPPFQRGNYEEQHVVVEDLVAKVGEKVVSNAYFDGSVFALKFAIWRYLVGQGETWRDAKTGASNWIVNMKNGDYADAMDDLKP